MFGRKEMFSRQLGLFNADILRKEGSPTHIGEHLMLDRWFRVFPVMDTLVRELAHIVRGSPLNSGTIVS